MKFPSLSKITSEARAALFRFPLSLVCAISASFVAIYLVGSDLNTFLLHLLLTLALGIPLFFSLDVLAEKRNFAPAQTWIGRSLGIAVLATILISFPDRSFDEINKAPYIRYTVFNLAFHLVVAFVPYLSLGYLSSFWTYNKNLFIRMVTGLFYSSVIWLGIMLAVAAIKELFGVEFYDEVFSDIMILSFGVFNTWFFLAGIPHDFDQETQVETYPKGLKIFTQFILIPLLLIYLAILYAYGTKIILTWDWPKGLVVYLIIAIAVLGIFTNLLLFPYQEDREHGWIRKFYKAFYFLLIPLVALLFLAIGIRIGEYGLTLNRYLVVLMGIWLTFISGYFILGRHNIKTVPISLAAILILASFGPWGMFGLSEKMQVERLRDILSEGGIFVEGKIQNEVAWEMTSAGNLRAKGPKNTNSLEAKELNQVNSILHYLGEYHSWEGVYPWIAEETRGMIENSETKNSERTEILVETMGLTYVPWYEANYNSDVTANESSGGLFELEAGAPLEISGYDRMIYFVAYPDYSSGESLESLKGNDYSINKPGSLDENLVLTWKDREINFPTAKLFADLRTRVGQGENKNLDTSELSLEVEENSLAFRLIIKKVSFEKTANQKMWIEAYSGFILVKERN